MLIQEEYIRVANGRGYLLFVKWLGLRRFFSLDGLRWYVTPETAVREGAR